MFAGSGGAREASRRRRRRAVGVALATASAAWLLTASLAACSTDDEPAPPTELADGSPVRRMPVELEGMDGPVVLTRVRVRPAGDVPTGSASAACLRERGGREAAGIAPVVERVGVHSETVTFEVASGRGLVACDGSPGSHDDSERWCGGAFGSLVDGRLRDPRLDILCSTAKRDAMAFAWAQPGSEAAFVAVSQPGYTEVYEVAVGMPVRVATTSGVDAPRASAEFAISEHDAAGARLRRYVLRASVAG